MDSRRKAAHVCRDESQDIRMLGKILLFLGFLLIVGGLIAIFFGFRKIKERLKTFSRLGIWKRIGVKPTKYILREYYIIKLLGYPLDLGIILPRNWTEQ